MNKYIRGLIVIPCGLLKMIALKTFHPKDFSGASVCQISPFAEITLDAGGKLSIGRNFKMRDGAKLRVRTGAKLSLGSNVSVSSNCIITCRDSIRIGSNVSLSPNVLIYDHDHDYAVEGGIWAGKYKSSPIEIGDNCWIGCNTVVLRGTRIGDNCVVGAGCILNGQYPDGSVIIQKRRTEVLDNRWKMT